MRRSVSGMNPLDDAPNEVQITVRIPHVLNERISELAAYHGRSRSAEVRTMLAYFDASATLAALHEPEAEADLGEAIHAMREEVKRDLAEITQAAFRPRPRLPFAHMN